MVPILIKVQQLQRRLIDQPDDFGTAWNWVDTFLRLKYHDQPAVYHFLRQALLSRRVLLLLDGLDEGGAKRDEIQRHVTEVLAPQGHVMLCTLRPAGVTEKSFPGFQRFHLSPLTKPQQQEALEQRLGATAVAPLLEYLKRMPVGDDGQRVTTNPLMLSMTASVYELRQGVGMPETIAELYEHASEAMLSRGGASSKELRRLMQAVFFKAHVADCSRGQSSSFTTGFFGTRRLAGSFSSFLIDHCDHTGKWNARHIRASLFPHTCIPLISRARKAIRA